MAAFRSRRNFYDWRSVERNADIAETGIQQLREATRVWGVGALLPTAQKSIAAVVRVVHHADDSNGAIGFLVDFQFDRRQGLFALDVAAYADALGT